MKKTTANIQTRSDTATNWTTSNPVLLLNEHAVETDTGKVKVGDGASAWTDLDYYVIPLFMVPYTVTTVPSASTYSNSMIYVTDETGGTIPAFSDGTNWRRVSDRAVISV